MSTPVIVFNSLGGSYAQADNSTALANNLSNFSVSIWIKATSAADTQTEIIDKSTNFGQQSGTGWVIKLGNGTPGGARFTFNNTSVVADYNVSLVDSIWHHIVAIKDNSLSNIQLYIDNVLQATTSTAALGSFSNSEPIRVGTDPSSGSSFFRGEITLIGIWNIALTSTDVSNLYTSNILPSTPSIAYWPCNDGSGSVATNTVNGTQNLSLTNITWATDGPTFPVTFNLNLSDSLFSSDSTTKEDDKTISDSVTSSDSLALARAQNVSDSMTVTDSFSLQSSFIAPNPLPSVEILTNNLVPAEVKTFWKFQ